MQEKRKRKESDSQDSAEAAPGKRPSTIEGQDRANVAARNPAPATGTPKTKASAAAVKSKTAAPTRQHPVDAAPQEEEQEEWVSHQTQAFCRRK